MPIRERGQSAEDIAPFNPPPALGSSTATSFNIRRTLSLRWKILSIAVISAVTLMLYLMYATNEARSNAALMKDIFENKYPIQALMQSSQHNLELVNRELNDAVITGDKDLVFSAEPMAEEFRSNMEAAIWLDPVNGDKIRRIQHDFEVYYVNSTTLATQLLSADAYQDKLSSRTEQNQASYEKVVQSMQAFQKERFQAFAQSIDDTTTKANKAVIYGLWISLTAVAMVLLLASVIARSILSRIHLMVATLKRIAHEDDGMSVRIDLDGGDEMTELAHWFNTFIGKLERVTSESTAEIKRIAYTDTLSGLPNRRMLIESIEAAIEKPQNEQVAVLFLDLDNFKPINDQLGHEAGDELIRQAAKRLRLVIDDINASDIRYQQANSGALAGRLGGDEFMLLLPHISDQQSIEDMAVRIRDELLVPFNLNGSIAHIGVSIGISRYPLDANNKDSLIDYADIAMYEAKAAGKNTYRFFNGAIAESAAQASRIEKALKGSIENNELSLLYQPKINLISGSYNGSEALLRWHNEELGAVSPIDFISLAEKSKVIHAIDEWVLAEVCKTISDWLERGINPGRIAINMSAKQIQQPDLMDTILPIIDRYDTPCEHLEFEITESSALDHMEVVVANVQKIRERNIHVTMDDFGAGHSSLQLLVNCKLDSVKIDQTLTKNINQHERYQSIVRSIINLADTLDIQSVAEGIETYEQLNLLSRFNCQNGQGYYFSKPVSSVKIENYMIQHRPRARA